MAERIGQRELRNDNAEIMRRVERGELERAFVRLPPVDSDRWEADRRTDDDIFGPDDPTDDPWRRQTAR